VKIGASINSISLFNSIDLLYDIVVYSQWVIFFHEEDKGFLNFKNPNGGADGGGGAFPQAGRNSMDSLWMSEPHIPSVKVWHLSYQTATILTGR
jgi:hypothetical protein